MFLRYFDDIAISTLSLFRVGARTRQTRRRDRTFNVRLEPIERLVSTLVLDRPGSFHSDNSAATRCFF